MFYAIISTHGMGIYNDAAEVGRCIDRYTVIEVRSYFNLPEAQPVVAEQKNTEQEDP